MINAIKNKYYQYDPAEFLPIYRDGVLDNKREFHALKAKKTLKAVGAALVPLGERIDNFFVNH